MGIQTYQPTPTSIYNSYAHMAAQPKLNYECKLGASGMQSMRHTQVEST